MLINISLIAVTNVSEIWVRKSESGMVSVSMRVFGHQIIFFDVLLNRVYTIPLPAVGPSIRPSVGFSGLRGKVLSITAPAQSLKCFCIAAPAHPHGVVGFDQFFFQNRKEMNAHLFKWRILSLYLMNTLIINSCLIKTKELILE